MLKSIVKDPIKTLLVKPAARATEALGRVGVFGKQAQTGYEAMADEGAPQEIKTPFGKYNIEAVKPGMSGAKQVAGEGLKVASYLAGGVGGATAAKGALGGTLGASVKTGAIAGAKAGGMYGGGQALEEDLGAVDVAKRAATGAAIGGAVGAAFPVVIDAAGRVVRGTAKTVAERGTRKAEEAALVRSGAPEASVATKTVGEGGKIVTDKVAKEAVRQGIPEADVALIKGGTATDKAKMIRMLDIRQSQLTNKRVTDRATDVVGDTFVKSIAKPIEDLNRTAAKELDIVARGLAGKKTDVSPAVKLFAEELDRAGVSVGKGGVLNFKNSNFEGLKGPQQLIQNVWNRAVRVARTGDALQAHRVKSYIDEIVNYGKEAEGLSGKAETMLKQLRRAIDSSLDTQFPKYNAVNTTYAETISELNRMGVVLGRKFRLGDTFADAQSGVAMRRILSNTQSRAEILKLLDNMQAIAKKYGIKIDDDIITQANFADTLEKMLGPEAPTSLAGEITKGLESFGSSGGYGGAQQVGSAAGEFARGNVVRGTIKAGGAVIDVLRGVSQENKIKALRALLKAEAKGGAGSVFGRPATPNAPSVAPLAGVFGKKAPVDKSVAKVPTARYTESVAKQAKTTLGKADKFKEALAYAKKTFPGGVYQGENYSGRHRAQIINNIWERFGDHNLARKVVAELESQSQG